MTTNSLNFKRTLFAIALTAVYPMHAMAAAGVAQFIAGDVNVRKSDGKLDALQKGKDVDSGDAILTGASGRAQVKFTDGGLVSLQPNTEFKIANYVDQADPKQDRFLVDLLRGSMRAITGLIGKRNRDNYRVTTTTATIGIRGSGFTAGYRPDGSLVVTAELDAIEVSNSGGSVRLIAGESVRVTSSTQAPQRTIDKAPVQTPGLQQITETTGNKTAANGTALIVPRPPPSAEVSLGPNSGMFTNVTFVGNYYKNVDNQTVNEFTYPSPTANGSVTLVNGNATTFRFDNATYTPISTAAGGTLGNISTNDFITWGNWVTGTRQQGMVLVSQLENHHYLVGQPTAVLPTTVGVASYTVVGNTTPTSYLGTNGLFLGATFSANFDTAAVGGPMLGVTVNTSFGNISEPFVYFSNSAFASASGTVRGFFSGPNANRAGLVYNAPVTAPNNTAFGGHFNGAVVFQRSPTGGD